MIPFDKIFESIGSHKTSFFSDIDLSGTPGRANTMIRTHSRYYNYDTDYERQARQRARIEKLHKMLKQKQAGVPVDLAEVLMPLQKAGILDAEGNLTEHYRNED